jgi:hyperosmotically inducible periplasmic protein
MSSARRMSWAACVVAALFVAGCSKSDPGITAAVKAKLAADDTVKAYQIDVDTKEGVVSLTGTVDTAAAKARAAELARATDGVVRVVDNVTVRVAVPPQAQSTIDSAQAALTDAAITTAVKTKLLADTAVSGLKIDVDTKDGVVTLSGRVPTNTEKQRAVTLSRDTTGVKSVNDQLKVGK